MSDSPYPDENFPDISHIDWRTLDKQQKIDYWRERKMEFLVSDHHTVSGFLKERGLDENTYWQKGWSKEKELVIRNAEMMHTRQISNNIADVMQLAYNVEGYAIATLASKLKKENQTMKVTDIIAIVNLMRLIQGKPSSVESSRAKKSEEDDLVIVDIDGQYVNKS